MGAEARPETCYAMAVSGINPAIKRARMTLFNFITNSKRLHHKKYYYKAGYRCFKALIINSAIYFEIYYSIF